MGDQLIDTSFGHLACILGVKDKWRSEEILTIRLANHFDVLVVTHARAFEVSAEIAIDLPLGREILYTRNPGFLQLGNESWRQTERVGSA